MFQILLRLKSRVGKTHEMLQALRTVMVRAQFEQGYEGATLYTEANEVDRLCYIEEWDTEPDLEREIRSPRFGYILAISETAVETPVVLIRALSDARGLEYVQALRGRRDDDDANRNVN